MASSLILVPCQQRFQTPGNPLFFRCLVFCLGFTLDLFFDQRLFTLYLLQCSADFAFFEAEISSRMNSLSLRSR